uniref:hypothetical protein n=1 Tax=Arctium tomentosum TaxID=4218 RepID=UPI001D129B1F|nr:hypothetical protein LK293_mgp002 [Arctium tomentosum]YP_010194792.1 hypothetical protein LK293_mgp103 [Arctium tomentosum]YP_010194892.1 hypothetical protein LK294_mgp002 [Arctium lappa]YP_010194922.1 hypothetical protein LK294_mgp104 [Arctium lappa]QZZ81501.1 hypothetical protein [Arctium tomentosum]QZZ81531.1 hypothetical protein [Arctium tomentosum]QZZ81631.1 hypothetical protein [Arctium lappa]QZZ81661.1 hypothetical protein [Arctium lappa]
MRVSKRKKSSFLRNSHSHFIIIYFSEKFIFSLMTGITILQVSSGSSESGNPTSLPALESSSSSESWATFRAEIAAENEAEIYARIRSLQSHYYYNLPPQNNPGEYEGLVRDHLDQALDVPHYRTILDMEYFELTVLERKVSICFGRDLSVDRITYIVQSLVYPLDQLEHVLAKAGDPYTVNP